MREIKNPDKMTIAPLQAFGVGDIIWCQTIANEWIKAGHNVVWGTVDYLVEGLNRAYPNIKFVDYKTLPINYNRQDEHDSHGYRVIPLRWNVEILNIPYRDCMKGKYWLFNMEWERWREGAMWIKDKNKEQELLKILEIKPEDKFNLISPTFGTNLKLKVPITLRYIPGFSLFDWAVVFELATNIHVVSSSNIYIMEMLDLVAEEIKIYIRRPNESNHDNYKYILQKHKYTFE
jgi:hypothetical protein